MTTVGRVDQLLLVLQDKLRKLGEQSANATYARTGETREIRAADPYQSLRSAIKNGRVKREELRRALVRALLSESLGPGTATSIEFQEVSDRVSAILSDSESGRELLDRAIAELG